MTLPNKQIQALKAAAEKAGADEWQMLSGDDEYKVIVKGSMKKYGGWSTHRPVAEEVAGRTIARFIAAASPAAILSLLAEREADKALIAEQAKRITELEARTLTVKLPNDDIKQRNQPGLVVAVHIDAGDFVNVKGQVFEVKETEFDDHDVTLWFVGGQALKCAAGCPIEVVSSTNAAGITLVVGGE